MDGKGRATDNSCIERFWRSTKCERIYLNEYQSISELITDVDDYIEMRFKTLSILFFSKYKILILSKNKPSNISSCSAKLLLA
jgi:transposase InsO family protein